MNNENIILNKSEIKKYSDIEEQKATINLLEDLNIKLEEIEYSNKLLNQGRKAIINILDDSFSLNQRIKKERAQFQAILTNMNDSLYVVDLDEKIIVFNSAAEKVFGWPLNDVVGKTDSEIFPSVRFANAPVADKYGLPYLIHSAWKNGKSINLSFIALPRKDGSEVIVAISAAPILDENKNVAFGIVTMRDMRHEFEIDRAKTEFVSVASHQLRTPLAAIKWFLELVLGGDAGKITAEQKDFLTQISESTERMIDLVNSLLNVSRIETGRITIDPKPTNMTELVEKAAKEIGPVFKKRKQNFKFIKPKISLPDINIDPKLIFEVIVNLLSNTSKYSPEERPITLGLEQVDEEIMFKISDNGYGIPAHQQHRVFEKFFRGENIMKYAPEGTGLGLYIVKAIIESSGGRIWFKSKENEGTTFYFTLPIAGSKPRLGEKSIELTKRFI